MIELEPEVEYWLNSLPKDDRGKSLRNIERLAEVGNMLTYPYTSQLDGKLRELRFYLSSGKYRITYYIGPKRKIRLLTVFRKTKQRETREIARAVRIMNSITQRDEGQS